ncbi:MAG: DNA-binding transcriptional regulator [Phyllobacteriaceae bacterium]|nr:DNA-binding transcriptional regulator [Phyllobacteriaceae bacterium]
MARIGDSEAAGYKQVQGLSRGLSVLRALNAAAGGWASIRELGAATGLHRTTVRRLLETLMREGLVRRSTSDDSWRLTIEVRGLSEGFSDDEWISQIATPVLGDLLREVVWPSDLTTLDGDAMIIRETTHRFSPLSFHRDMVRVRMPLLSTAAGRAYLAFCPEEEREGLLARLAAAPNPPPFLADRRVVDRLLDATRERGIASNVGEWSSERKITAIALPIFHRDKVAGCVNIVMLRKAIALETAIEKYAGPLRRAVAAIEARLAETGLAP